MFYITVICVNNLSNRMERKGKECIVGGKNMRWGRKGRMIKDYKGSTGIIWDLSVFLWSSQQPRPRCCLNPPFSAVFLSSNDNVQHTLPIQSILLHTGHPALSSNARNATQTLKRFRGSPDHIVVASHSTPSSILKDFVALTTPSAL